MIPVADDDADPRVIQPITDPFRISVTPPGSKSLANRALILAALAEGPSTIANLPVDAQDVHVLLDALASCGVMTESQPTPPSAINATITNDGGIFPGNAQVNLANAGTATRFLTAAATLASHPVEIDGSPRMRERPIGELVDLLRELGARITYLEREGCVPLRIEPAEMIGGTLRVGRTLSSQYISAILMLAPRCRDGVTIEFTEPPRSPTYIGMTLSLMHELGASIDAEPDLSRIRVAHGKLRGFQYTVEPDASSATYFLAAAALTPGAVCTIEGLGKGSRQGDVMFADALGEMGAGLTFGRDFLTVIGPEAGRMLRGIEIDGNLMPDAAMTLAIVAASAQSPTTIRNLSNLRHKETDRLAAMQTELAKIGAHMSIEDEGDIVEIEPRALQVPATTEPVRIETYDDHRMAMAFAVAGLRPPVPVTLAIADPSCVGKSYGSFWDDFALIGM